MLSIENLCSNHIEIGIQNAGQNQQNCQKEAEAAAPVNKGAPPLYTIKELRKEPIKELQPSVLPPQRCKQRVKGTTVIEPLEAGL